MTSPTVCTQWRWFAGGAAVAVAIFWLPVLLLCGPRQVLLDLVFDQARHVLPARHLPMPSPFALAFGGGLLVPLPAALQHPLEGAIALAFLGPLLAALAAKKATTAPQRGCALVLGAFALAVIPQLLGRTDLAHSVYTVPPALVLLAVLLVRTAGSPRRRVGIALLAIAACTWPLRDVLPVEPPATPRVLPLLERAAGRPVRAEAARQQVLQFVADNTAADEPVWFGLADHSAVDTNEVDLYFFADRRGATRYLQFDPELVDRAEVQAQMIAELERSGVRIAVTSALPPRRVRSDGGAGSDRLDRWLAEHFAIVRTVGPYRLLRRRDGR